MISGEDRSRSMLMLRQCSGIEFPGLRPIFVHSPGLENGPMDDLVENAGKEQVSVECEKGVLLKSWQQKLISAELIKEETDVFDFQRNDPLTNLIRQFDIVNSFAIVRTVLAMYQRALEEVVKAKGGEAEVGFDFLEAWGSRLKIDPYAFCEKGPLALYQFAD